MTTTKLNSLGDRVNELRSVCEQLRQLDNSFITAQTNLEQLSIKENSSSDSSFERGLQLFVTASESVELVYKEGTEGGATFSVDENFFPILSQLQKLFYQWLTPSHFTNCDQQILFNISESLFNNHPLTWSPSLTFYRKILKQQTSSPILGSSGLTANLSLTNFWLKTLSKLLSRLSLKEVFEAWYSFNSRKPRLESFLKTYFLQVADDLFSLPTLLLNRRFESKAFPVLKESRFYKLIGSLLSAWLFEASASCNSPQKHVGFCLFIDKARRTGNLGKITLGFYRELYKRVSNWKPIQPIPSEINILFELLSCSNFKFNFQPFVDSLFQASIKHKSYSKPVWKHYEDPVLSGLLLAILDNDNRIPLVKQGFMFLLVDFKTPPVLQACVSGLLVETLAMVASQPITEELYFTLLSNIDWNLVICLQLHGIACVDTRCFLVSFLAKNSPKIALKRFIESPKFHSAVSEILKSSDITLRQCGMVLARNLVASSGSVLSLDFEVTNPVSQAQNLDSYWQGDSCAQEIEPTTKPSEGTAESSRADTQEFDTTKDPFYSDEELEPIGEPIKTETYVDSQRVSLKPVVPPKYLEQVLLYLQDEDDIPAFILAMSCLQELITVADEGVLATTGPVLAQLLAGLLDLGCTGELFEAQRTTCLTSLLVKAFGFVAKPLIIKVQGSDLSLSNKIFVLTCARRAMSIMSGISNLDKPSEMEKLFIIDHAEPKTLDSGSKPITPVKEGRVTWRSSKLIALNNKKQVNSNPTGIALIPAHLFFPLLRPLRLANHPDFALVDILLLEAIVLTLATALYHSAYLPEACSMVEALLPLLRQLRSYPDNRIQMAVLLGYTATIPRSVSTRWPTLEEFPEIITFCQDLIDHSPHHHLKTMAARLGQSITDLVDQIRNQHFV